MTFRPATPHKRRRWLAVLFIGGVLAATNAATVLAVVNPPDFTSVWDNDDQGANDEPGQKDLTAQAAAFNGSDFYSAWLWDDTSWSGKNTGDGCSLFDTDSPTNGLVDYAVCVTVGGKNPVQLSMNTYSCGDSRPDRCTNPVLLLTDTAATYCVTMNNVTGMFDALDTEAACNITAISNFLSGDTLGSATLLNTCSYPSREPNSDPSDCVKTVANIPTSVSTSSGGSGSVTFSWSATLTDSATVSGGATGSVTFSLYSDASCATTAIFTDTQNLDSSGSASTAGKTITNLTVDADGIYYWKVDYTPSGTFDSSSSGCGEATTINAPSAPAALTVTGSTHP